MEKNPNKSFQNGVNLCLRQNGTAQNGTIQNSRADNFRIPNKEKHGSRDSDGPQVTIKSENAFRIKKIEVSSNFAIDQIKITYDDDTVWTCGHSEGKKNNSVLIITKGEYLVRVTHESFVTLKCAAASIETKTRQIKTNIETNKGRKFTYYPNYKKKIVGRIKQELTTIDAFPGKEIYGLTIRRVVLIGSHQQPVPSIELVRHPKAWYSILHHKPKEDDLEDCLHYYGKPEAVEKFQTLVTTSCKDKRTAVVLVDCISRSVLKTNGDKESIDLCIKRATELGLYARKAEDDISMMDVILKLLELLTCKKDVAVILIVTLLLFLSFSLNLEASLLTGDVITLVTSNGTEYRNNWYADKTCKYFISCDGTKESYGMAILAAFLAVKIIENLLYVLNVYIHQHACDTKFSELHLQGFNKILSLDQTYFDEHSESDIRSSFDGEAITRLITWNFPYLVTQSLRFIMVGFYLLSIHFSLGLFAIACMIFLKLAILDPIRKKKKQARKSQKIIERNGRQITDDVISMISTVMMFSHERFHIKQLEQVEERFTKTLHNFISLRCLQEFSFSMMSVTMLVFSLFVCHKFTYLVDLKTSDLIGFFLLLEQFQHIYWEIQWHVNMLTHEFPDIERFVTLMESKPSLVSGEIPLKDIQGSVEFDNVHFVYPSRPGEAVLKGFNLKITPDKMTAIVGDSGAGKSTITKLLLRLYDPTEGSIKIDGRDLRTLDLCDVHKQIGIVSQNPELFDLPLGENIAYGTEETLTEDSIEHAANLANCDFVSKFRAGFDTFVGSAGSQLSGGQKQRVAIARAIIRNPKILILDEATSSLDAENEKLVQDSLDKVMKNRTVIVIAHRLSTIKNADEIICMKDGEAVERGTHEELMVKKDAYYNLVCRQTDEEKKRI